MNADRLPPRGPEKELLGAIIRWNAIIGDVAEIVKPRDLYAHGNSLIYQAILDVWAKGGPVDCVIIAEELHRAGSIEDVGGYGYLGELLDGEPTGAKALHYAGIIRDAALRRRLIHAGTAIAEMAFRGEGGSADDLAQDAERTLFAATESAKSGRLVPLSVAIGEAAEAIDARLKNGGVSGTLTGMAELDEITCGLQAGELSVIAARPSVGKTSFALAMANNVVFETGCPVFFVSLEQSRAELAERLISSVAGIDSAKLRRARRLGDGEYIEITRAIGTLRTGKMWIEDQPARTVMHIATAARQLKLRHNIGAVFIDYLQLIEPENRRVPRHEQIGAISHRLKNLAKELQIPVVLLAQLNRNSEARSEPKPKMADIRESGDVEQDADVIMLLHNPERSEKSGHVVIVIDIAKNRNGPRGTVAMIHDRARMRFSSNRGYTPFD